MIINPTILAEKNIGYEEYRLLQIGPIFAIEQQNPYDSSDFAFFTDEEETRELFNSIETSEDWNQLEQEKKIKVFHVHYRNEE
jgi:hypothetical protein